MTNHEVWQAILAEFELQISKANFITWFSDTGILKYEDGCVDICVPNKFTKGWLEKKYHSEIVRLLEKITKRPVKRVIYIVENIKNVQEQNCLIVNNKKDPTGTTQTTPPTNNYEPQRTAGQFSPFARINTIEDQSNRLPIDGHSFGLNTNYIFDTFIVGKNNELAHAAAQAVASRPGEAYNPLFIYGGVGLGKTHLLQAIAHSMLAKNPRTRFLYVTSEKFTNEFISAVQQKKITSFKEKYRNVDLLLIDDIQFIGGKEQTQEEFFHTFNELHQNKKQVVLTSDRPPKAISSLEDRLRSRFEWGMIADVSAPDLETRAAILQAKCYEKNFNLSEEIIDMIASSIQSNIRELEGALNKIIAFHELKNIFPSTDTIKPMLSSFENSMVKAIVSAKELIAVVSEFYNVRPQDLVDKNRARQYAFPRQIIMYLLRSEMNMSFPSIGNELGGRDHTTAMHAHNKIDKQIKKDEKLKQEIESLKQKLFTQKKETG